MAECPVCDSTDYVLRQGEYFCRMCNTQSQELGTETVMDDETVPVGIQGRTDTITMGRAGKKKGSKKNLLDGVKWSTAEGFSWILRGWVDQLKTMGVDVELAVLQLWSLYLRKLRLAFEKRGEEGCIGEYNLFWRERWNLIGGPPRLIPSRTMRIRKKRRLAPEQEEEDEEETNALLESKRRSKKRRQFLKSVSNPDSGTDTEPEPMSPSSACEGIGGPRSLLSDYETDYSESGYVTDSGVLAQMLARFKPRPQKSFMEGPALVSALASPECLRIEQLAALLTLAVIGRPNSSITISEMVWLFNSEAISYDSAIKFLPPSYAPLLEEYSRFKGPGSKFTTKILSSWVFRLSSFLYHHDLTVAPKKLNLAFTLPTSRSLKSSPFTFLTALSRFLGELCLPSVFCKDIYKTFKRLHLTNISATLVPYNFGCLGWNTGMFPQVSKRILALILLSLKIYCGVDDQYEVFMSHNIKKIATLPNGADVNYFDLVSWIRLSKLRLDQLMSTNHCIREQYQTLRHVGTPNLTLPGVITKLKLEDKVHYGPGGQASPPPSRLEELGKLMSALSVSVKPSNNSNLTLTPLSDETQSLLLSGGVKPQVKRCVEKLKKMTETDMRLYNTWSSKNWRHLVHVSHGVYFTKKNSNVRRASLAKNWISIQDDFLPRNVRFENKYQFRRQGRSQFVEMVNSGKTRKSLFRVPNPKAESEKLFNVTKSYWFSHTYLQSQFKRDFPRFNEELFTEKLLTIVPSNFAWILKYFACYAHLSPLDLMEELNDIEKLILALDPDYFGFPRKLRALKTMRLPWKGAYVKIGANSPKKPRTKKDEFELPEGFEVIEYESEKSKWKEYKGPDGTIFRSLVDIKRFFDHKATEGLIGDGQ